MSVLQVRYVSRSHVRAGVLFLFLLMVASCAPVDVSVRPAATDDILLYLVYDVDGNMHAASLSAEGVVRPLSSDNLSDSVPRLRGLNYNNIQNEARIPVRYTPILQSMSLLREQLPELYNSILDVFIISKSHSSYEIQISTQFTSLPIVSVAPIPIAHLETIFLISQNPSFTAASNDAKYISIRGVSPIIRYDQLDG